MADRQPASRTTGFNPSGWTHMILGSGRRVPLTNVPSRAGFVMAMAIYFREASGNRMKAGEALDLARAVYHDLLPQCGGRHGNPEYDWSIAAAFEWASSDVEHWEQGH